MCHLELRRLRTSSVLFLITRLTRVTLCVSILLCWSVFVVLAVLYSVYVLEPECHLHGRMVFCVCVGAGIPQVWPVGRDLRNDRHGVVWSSRRFSVVRKYRPSNSDLLWSLFYARIPDFITKYNYIQQGHLHNI